MSYNPYFFNNPGYTPNYMTPQMNRLQQLENQYSQYQMYNNPNIQNNIQNMNNMGLQGKAVDSIDVVKAMDVPLDGSITYFPKTDGSAIFTKQLQPDGTSKVNIYELDNKTSNNKIIDINNSMKPEFEKIREELNNIQSNVEKSIDNLSKKIDEFSSMLTLINNEPSQNRTNIKSNKGVK